MPWLTKRMLSVRCENRAIVSGGVLMGAFDNLPWGGKFVNTALHAGFINYYVYTNMRLSTCS